MEPISFLLLWHVSLSLDRADPGRETFAALLRPLLHCPPFVSLPEYLLEDSWHQLIGKLSPLRLLHYVREGLGNRLLDPGPRDSVAPKFSHEDNIALDGRSSLLRIEEQHVDVWLAPASLFVARANFGRFDISCRLRLLLEFSGGLINQCIVLRPKAPGIGVFRRTVVLRVLHFVCVFERKNANGQRIRLSSTRAAPENSVTGNRLVEETAEDVVAK